MRTSALLCGGVALRASQRPGQSDSHLALPYLRPHVTHHAGNLFGGSGQLVLATSLIGLWHDSHEANMA